jgi:hypothetical protein
MKVKTILTFLFTLFVGSLIFIQATQPVKGDQTSLPSTPSTFYSLKGRVTLIPLRRWIRPFKKVIPGRNITIKAKNLDTGDVSTTKTDYDGVYSFTLLEGKYTITPKGNNRRIFFIPRQRTVILNENKENIDFKGIIGKPPSFRFPL